MEEVPENVPDNWDEREGAETDEEEMEEEQKLEEGPELEEEPEDANIEMEDVNEEEKVKSLLDTPEEDSEEELEEEVDPEKERELLGDAEVSQEEIDPDSEEKLRDFLGHKTPDKKGDDPMELGLKIPNDSQSDEASFDQNPTMMEDANSSSGRKISIENSLDYTGQCPDSPIYQEETQLRQPSKTDQDILLIEEKQGGKDGEEEEIQVVGEKKGGEERQEARGGSSVHGGRPPATVDIRCKEVTISRSESDRPKDPLDVPLANENEQPNRTKTC